MKKSFLFIIFALFLPLLAFALLAPVAAATGKYLFPAKAAAVPTSVLSPAEMEKAASKMEEAVLSALRNGAPDETLTVIVHVGGAADLTGAAQFTRRADRGAYVVRELQTHAARTQADLRAELARMQQQETAVSYRPYFIFNGIAVTAPSPLIWQLALRADVEAITVNHVYRLDSAPQGSRAAPAALSQTTAVVPAAPQAPEWNIAQINADDVWTTYGVTGTGVLVANLDSGVQYDHPALIQQYAGNLGGTFDHNFTWFDATQNAGPSPYDDNGHGTHTMGTTVGGDGPGPFADDVGVAPGASWIAVKAFSAAGTGVTTDIHAAFEWLLAPCPTGVAPGDPACDPARAPQIVNNSWGSDNGARTEFLPDVQALRAAGIWPSFSAGNNGPAPGTIGSPASFSESFATGATDNQDVIASFSSRGPSPLTGEVKPDVVAPGVNVRSAYPGGSYTSLQGTSMAGPHSSGLAALMWSAAPNLNLDLMEEIMRSTAVDLGPAGPDMDYGYGRIDALRAMQRLVDSGNLAGEVRDAADLTPIAGAAVQAVGQGLDVTVTTDGSGAYDLSYLIPGTYTVNVDYYGYNSVVTTTTIITNSTTTLNLDLASLPRYTLSGFVRDAVSPTIPITDAIVTVLDTPLPPVQTDANGFYSLTVAAGPGVIEAAAFSYATGVTATVIMTDTVIDFYLDPLPPILLVDDDEGRLRSYSPHVESFYFAALDANGYNYTYWDIELQGAPDYDTLRQYAAVLWFGGEFGRIKDISDAGQAQAVMDYLDLGGRFLYVAQEHTFYYGDDGDCDTPRWGGTGPCPFTEYYLGIADWVEDQKADAVHGVAGNPVGDGLGPIVMNYPPGLADFSDQITGTIHASLAFSATDDVPPGDVNDVVYTVVSPTHSFKTVYMATPLEAMPANDAADVIYAVMEWFGVSGLAEGLTLSPPLAQELADAGHPITVSLRIRNLSPFSDTFSLSVAQMGWPTTIWDVGGTTPITEVGPIAPQATADFLVTIDVPVGTPPGATADSVIRAVSQSGTPFSDEATLTAGARMNYYVLDSDQCDSGVHFNWVDATGGTRWDLDDSPPLPEFVQVPLPQTFLFYNEPYDHLWLNDHATILFGDDNVYDDQFPSGDPPIPNPTLLDPNGAIYLNWGTSFWHPSYQPPETAVYTFHDTSQGRNWFIIEYHQYPNLLGSGNDTMQVILDLDTGEITLQYHTVTYHNFAVVGIENQTGLDGILYVNDQVPAQNMLHDELAIRFGVGTPPDVYEAVFDPAAAAATGQPNGTVEYLLTLHHTGNLTDSYNLGVSGADWTTTLWDATFTNPLSSVGPLTPCSQAQVGVRVTLPPDAHYVFDVAHVSARSQLNPLLVADSVLTTDNAAPAVSAGPDLGGSAPSGYPVTYRVALTNTGNITDAYDLALAGGGWPIAFVPPLTQTALLPPGGSEVVTAVATIPPATTAGTVDTAVLTAASQRYPGTADAMQLTTTAAVNVAVAWEQPYQTATQPAGFTAGYYVTLRNRGSVTDTFTLSTLADAWPITFWNDSFTQPLTQTSALPPDGTQRIGVRVQIPAAATAPQQDAVLLLARSTQDGQVYDWTMLVTAVSGPPAGDYDVTVTPAGAWQPALPGQTITYTLVVSNSGLQPDSYSVATAAQWPVQAPLTAGPLNPGAAAEIRVAVTIPADTMQGWDEVQVQLQSESDTAVSARADFLTVIGDGTTLPPPTYRLYLPLIQQ